MTARLRNPRLWILAGLAGLAGLAALHAWEPSTDPRDSVCVSRRLLDLPCPGCGMTRGFVHLAKGEWGAAFADHPLAPVLAAELVLAWLAWGVLLARGLPAARPRWLDPLLLAHAAVLVALWLGRAATGTLPW